MVETVTHEFDILADVEVFAELPPLAQLEPPTLEDVEAWLTRVTGDFDAWCHRAQRELAAGRTPIHCSPEVAAMLAPFLGLSPADAPRILAFP